MMFCRPQYVSGLVSRCLNQAYCSLLAVPGYSALQAKYKTTSSVMAQEVSQLSVPVPWGEIKGKTWGPDHGPPVLCLHGWADNCGTFNTLIPHLPKECRYVAVDLPGHGLSSHRPPGVFYSFVAYLADVRRVIDGLQWTKFSIIGHSMGGNVAALTEVPKVMREGMEEMLQYEKKTEEKKRVYTYEKAVERLLAANPTLSEKSAQILLERGLVQVEGGFVFSRDLRLHFKNIVRISLEQSLEMQSRIQASVLVVLAKIEEFAGLDSNQKKVMSTVLQGYRDRNHTVVKVPGEHHVHLDDPEVVAPLISDFLQTHLNLTTHTKTSPLLEK